jgi:hypothetical protein
MAGPSCGRKDYVNETSNETIGNKICDFQESIAQHQQMHHRVPGCYRLLKLLQQLCEEISGSFYPPPF